VRFASDLLVILIVSHCPCFQAQSSNVRPRWSHEKRASWLQYFTFAHLGFAFLISDVLAGHLNSFNSSKLVTVMGGFSTKWYESCCRTCVLNAALVNALRLRLVSSTLGPCWGRWRLYPGAGGGGLQGARLFSGNDFTRRFVMPEVITGLSLLSALFGIDWTGER